MRAISIIDRAIRKRKEKPKGTHGLKESAKCCFLEEIIRSLGENPFKTIASYNIADPTCPRKLKEELSLEKRF